MSIKKENVITLKDFLIMIRDRDFSAERAFESIISFKDGSGNMLMFDGIKIVNFKGNDIIEFKLKGVEDGK